MKEEHFIEDEDRVRLLEAIEQQAKSLSMARGAEHHRLSDWLNAAEEVMPEIKKPAVKPIPMSSSEPSSVGNSSLMRIFAIGTAFMATFAVGTVGYLQLNEQITLLKNENLTLAEQFKELSQKVKDVMEPTKQDEDKNKTVDTNTPQTTTDQLENKLKEQTSQLQTVLDERFNQLIEQISKQNQLLNTTMKAPSPIVPMTVQQAPVNAPSISTQSNAPASIGTPTAPVINEVKLTNSSSQPTETPSNTEEAWLQSLPAESLLLQLGSNVKADGLEAMGKKIRKNPDMAHVIPITANGSTRYILVYGAMATREEAKTHSDAIRNDLAVTPWIRRAADVKALLGKK